MSPVLSIRSGKHEAFVRLVFDGQGFEQITMEKSDDKVILLDVNPANPEEVALFRRRGDHLRSARMDGNRLEIQVDEGSRVSSFYLEPQIFVVDIYKPGRIPKEPPSTWSPSRQATIKTGSPLEEASPHGAGAAEMIQRLPPSDPEQQPAYPVAAAQKDHAASFAGDKGETMDAAGHDANPDTTTDPARPTLDDRQGGMTRVAPRSTDEDEASGERPIRETATARDGRSASSDYNRPDAQSQSGEPVEPERALLHPRTTLGIEGGEIDGAFALRFHWGRRVDAVAFLRAENLWIIFDAVAANMEIHSGDLGPRAHSAIKRLRREIESPMTALRIVLTEAADVQFGMNDGVWAARFLDAPRAGPGDASPTVTAARMLEIAVGSLGRRLDFSDPVIGDRLIAWPVSPDDDVFGDGVDANIAHSRFEVLSSIAGLVIRPLSDDLRVAAASDPVRAGDDQNVKDSPSPRDDRPTDLSMPGETGGNRRAADRSLVEVRSDADDGAGDSKRSSADGIGLRPGHSSRGGGMEPREKHTEVGREDRDHGGGASAADSEHPGKAFKSPEGDRNRYPQDDRGENPRGDSVHTAAPQTGEPAGLMTSASGQTHIDDVAIDPNVPAAEHDPRSITRDDDDTDRVAATVEAGTRADRDGLDARAAAMDEGASSRGAGTGCEGPGFAGLFIEPGSIPPELADAPTDHAARLDFARELIVHRLAIEASIVLEPLLADREPVPAPVRQCAEILDAIADVQRDRLDQAKLVLDDPRHADWPEISLWRGLIAAKELRVADAVRAFEREEEILRLYPHALFFELSLAAAEMTLESGDHLETLRRLDRLARIPFTEVQRQEFRFVDSMLAMRDGRLEQARNGFSGLTTGVNRIMEIKARYLLSLLDHQTGLRSLEETIADLEGQSLQWRDHPWEPTMFDGLANLKLSAGRTNDALSAWSTIIERRSDDTELAGEVEALMSEAVVGELVGASRSQDPASRYQLFRNYRDLIVGDDERTGVVRRLAEDLASAGFPEAAARLIEEESGMGVRAAADILTLAAYWLQASNPDRAMQLLANLSTGGFGTTIADMTRQDPVATIAGVEPNDRRERKLLAEALLNRGDIDLVVGLGEEKVSARQLAEAAWLARDWQLLARALEAAGPPDDAADPVQRLNAIRAILADHMLRSVSGDRTSNPPAERYMEDPAARALAGFLAADEDGPLTVDGLIERVDGDLAVIDELLTEMDNAMSTPDARP